jgi:SPP1 family predicted phage head-tail adaptor
MRAGTLRHRIIIQTKSEDPDGMGGAKVTWPEKDWIEVWARVKPIRGMEQIQALSLEGKITHQILMRYREGVTVAKRIYWKKQNKYFNIRSVINPDQRNISLEIMAQEEIR